VAANRQNVNALSEREAARGESNQARGGWWRACAAVAPTVGKGTAGGDEQNRLGATAAGGTHQSIAGGGAAGKLSSLPR